MPALWVPRAQEERYRDKREMLDAERDALVDEELSAQLDRATHFNRLLRERDEFLDLVFINEPRDAGAAPQGVVWGRWHVRRRNPGSSDKYMPVLGSNGEYAEPTSRIFDDLARGDMWNAEVNRDRLKRWAEEEAQHQRTKDREREERVEELAERWRAANEVRVLFSPDVPWSQNVGGKRGRS